MNWFDKMRAKLVDDLSAVWKRWSIWLMGAQVVILTTWGALVVAGLAPTVPDWLKWLVLVVLSAAAITVSPIKQKSLTKDDAQ